MTIPASRALALIAAVLVGFILLVALQPARLVVSRTGALGGRLAIAQAVLGDVVTLPSWAPGLAQVEGRVDGATRRGTGARLAWAGGDAGIEDASPLHTKVRIEMVAPRAERFLLTVNLDDQGSGLVGTMSYQGDPRSFGGKLLGFFKDPKEAIAARLDAALVNLAKAMADLEVEREREAQEQKAHAAKAAAAAAAAIKRAREQAEFEAGLVVPGAVAHRASVPTVVEKVPEDRPRKRATPERPPEGTPERSPGGTPERSSED